MSKRTDHRVGRVSPIPLILLILGTSACGRVIYVDDDANGLNNGLSWVNAHRYLQDALAGAQTGDEIRVAKGIYRPDRGTGITAGDRNATFKLKSGVVIKGGFPGHGSPDPNARDITKYETILSGDLAGNDIEVKYPRDLLNEPSRAENSYHVVIAVETGEGTILDGLIITGGNATGGPLIGRVASAGISVSQGTITIISCRITHNSGPGDSGIGVDRGNLDLRCSIVNMNCASSCGGGIGSNDGIKITISESVFENNTATKGGGALFNGGNLSVHKSTFRNNSCTSGNGGGIYAYRGTTVLDGLEIKGNTAVFGGGVYAHTGKSLMARNCLILGNTATKMGGGLCKEEFRFPFMLVNCTVVGNKAKNGGGFFWEHPPLELNGTFKDWREEQGIVNSIFWGNRSASASGEAAQVVLRDIVSFNYNCVEGWTGAFTGVGNTEADPCFFDTGYWDPNGTPRDPNDDFWVVDGDYHLKSQAGRWNPATQAWIKDDATSPCIDAGDPMSPIGLEPFPNGGRINMGAYGGTVEASKSYFGEPPCETIVAGDINGDCKVDLADLTILAQHWLDERR